MSQPVVILLYFTIWLYGIPSYLPMYNYYHLPNICRDFHVQLVQFWTVPRTSYPSYHELSLKRNSSRTLCSISNGTGYLLPTVILRFFWFRRYIPTVHYVLPVLDKYLLLYFLEFNIWNLDHLVTCGIPYANTYGIPANFTAKNTAKFREIPYVFQKIPFSVGSQNRTSVDTLVLS